MTIDGKKRIETKQVGYTYVERSSENLSGKILDDL